MSVRTVRHGDATYVRRNTVVAAGRVSKPRTAKKAVHAYYVPFVFMRRTPQARATQTRVSMETLTDFIVVLQRDEPTETELKTSAREFMRRKRADIDTYNLVSISALEMTVSDGKRMLKRIASGKQLSSGYIFRLS